MPTRAQVCAWIAGFGLVVPSLALAQDRTEREVVDLIVRDGPQASAIRAETEVTRREQLARLAYPNPGVMYSREGAGFTEFLQVEQSLPVFGTRAALSRAGVAATAAAEAERDARLWMLRADAVGAVARLAAEQARLEAAQAHTRDVERLIEILRTREREGEGSRFDRLRAEQELRETRQLVTSAAVAISEARAALSAMLPRDITVTRIAGALQPQQAVAPVGYPDHARRFDPRGTTCPSAVCRTGGSGIGRGSKGTTSCAHAFWRPETRGRRVWPRTWWCLRTQRIRAALRRGRAGSGEMGCRARACRC